LTELLFEAEETDRTWCEIEGILAFELISIPIHLIEFCEY